MYTPADCARCIDAVLEKLGLRDVHLVGHSYGGWLATQTAAHMPHRLATVTLVDPANTVTRLPARFWRSLALLLARPRSIGAERAAAWVTGHPPPDSFVHRLTELFLAGFAAFALPTHAPAPRFPTDRLLRSIDLPVQVFLAGNGIHDAAKGVQRIQSVVPAWRHHLRPNASHSLQTEVPAEVNACIREFAIEHHDGT